MLYEDLSAIEHQTLVDRRVVFWLAGSLSHSLIARLIVQPNLRIIAEKSDAFPLIAIVLTLDGVSGS